MTLSLTLNRVEMFLFIKYVLYIYAKVLYTRKCIFKYLLDCNFHITLLQETHSTTSIEHIWRKEWPGYSTWSHGSSSCKGVAVLLNPTFKGRFINHEIGESGRFLFSEIKIENSIFSVANVYGPNQDDPCFFQEFFQKLITFSAKDLIIGGDFNLILNDTLDKIGGPKHKNAQARNSVISHMNILQLKDIFRLKYPLAKSFTRIHLQQLDLFFFLYQNIYAVKLEKPK